MSAFGKIVWLVCAAGGAFVKCGFLAQHTEIVVVANSL